MNRLAASATVAAVALIGVTAPAFAHGPDTVTRTWHLPAGVNPNTAPFKAWWPQTVTNPGCVWVQVDTYRYKTETDRRLWTTSPTTAC